jgi:hypothetical protein
MDGLSVSVVPKERAGMATGIFSTTRVAGEGMTLAVAGAILAVLTRVRLSDALTGFAPTPQNSVDEAAQRVATGDLAHAVALLPALGQSVLVHAYDDAFRVLLHMLVAITLVSALVVLAFLGGATSTANVHDGDPTLSRK